MSYGKLLSSWALFLDDRKETDNSKNMSKRLTAVLTNTINEEILHTDTPNVSPELDNKSRNTINGALKKGDTTPRHSRLGCSLPTAEQSQLHFLWGPSRPPSPDSPVRTGRHQIFLPFPSFQVQVQTIREREMSSFRHTRQQKPSRSLDVDVDIRIPARRGPRKSRLYRAIAMTIENAFHFLEPRRWHVVKSDRSISISYRYRSAMPRKAARSDFEFELWNWRSCWVSLLCACACFPVLHLKSTEW